jgi:hypothetical protein
LSALAYDHLPTDVRMMALGLPARRKPGRPRALSFQDQLNVALCWGERLNARAQVGKSERHTALAALMKKLVRLQTAGAAPHKIREVQAMMNALGRYITLEIRPPEVDYPTIDREVAAEFDIHPRTVRRCRTDFRGFLSHPWNERAHEAEARTAFAAKQLAKRLMTPERLAKGERVVIAGGSLVVEQDRAAESTFKTAQRMLGLMRRVQHWVPVVSRPHWLYFKPQWTRMDVQAGDRIWINNQEVHVWQTPPQGRKILRRTFDTGEPLVDKE